MELSVLSCFLIAVWYWVINCDLGNLGRALMNPCLNGVLFGLVFGDVVTGTIIGATINIMYISIAAVGANMPADDSLAACVGHTDCIDIRPGPGNRGSSGNSFWYPWYIYG